MNVFSNCNISLFLILLPMVASWCDSPGFRPYDILRLTVLTLTLLTAAVKQSQNKEIKYFYQQNSAETLQIYHMVYNSTH